MKGTVRTGGLRLTSFLNAARGRWLQVGDPALLDFERGAERTAGGLVLRLDDVLLAHEYLDLAGDPLRKRLAQPDDAQPRRMHACFRAPSRLEIVGRSNAGAPDPAGSDEFFVVTEPELLGLDGGCEAAIAALRGLSYAIVNRSQLAVQLAHG